ncbi:MAG: hypothetical protein ACJ739_16525 [Acidimicrobiales bacterium]
MGRRDADHRPPIEILGSGPTLGSTQQVAMGPRRPKPGRRRSLAIAGLVMALLVGGVVLGSTDDHRERAGEEERDNQARIDLDKPLTSTTEVPTSTTLPAPTTTLAALGPVFGEPIDGVLLLYRGAQTWTRLDLTTGGRDEIELPSADPLSSVPMPGGLVIATGTDVRYYPVLGASRAPVGVSLGEGDQVARAGPDRVWVFDQPQSVDELSTQARIVDLRGRVLRQLDVPGFQGSATPESIVVGRGGRVYAYDESGYRPLATGWVNGVIGDDALITACDDDGGCALRRQPIDGGASRALVRIPDPDDTYYEQPSTDLDGRTAIVAHDNASSRQRLLLFAPDGDLLDEVGIAPGTEGVPQWLPGARGLLVGTTAGLQWVHPRGGEWVSEDLDLDGLGFPDTFFVVTP